MRFGLDGLDLEIDLSPDHEHKLREALRPFLAVARPTAAVKSRTRTPRPSPELQRQVKVWAACKGIPTPAVVPYQLVKRYLEDVSHTNPDIPAVRPRVAPVVFKHA